MNKDIDDPIIEKSLTLKFRGLSTEYNMYISELFSESFIDEIDDNTVNICLTEEDLGDATIIHNLLLTLLAKQKFKK
jgi:hypothetical protein